MGGKRMASRAEAYDAKREAEKSKRLLKRKKRMNKLETKAQEYAIKQARRLEKLSDNSSRGLLNTASHLFMAGVMLMFFVGVALGVYATIWRGEPVSTTMDYIMKLALVVGLGYFVKAFGENVAKIILPFIFGARKTGDSDIDDSDQQGNG